MMDIRLGRVGVLAEYINRHPENINKKHRTNAKTPESFMELALRFGQPNVAMWLMERGATETPQSAPALLHHAVLGGHTVLVRRLTEMGWDPTAAVTDSMGISVACPLHQAVASAHIFILEAWKEMGVDMTQANPRTGNTLLHVLCAASSNQAGLDRLSTTAVWLMRAGVSWNTPNAEGVFPGALTAYPDFETRLNDAWCVVCAEETRSALSSEVAPARAERVTKRM